MNYKSFFDNNDFILMIETWADKLSDLSVNGFKIIQLNRTEKNRPLKEILVALRFISDILITNIAPF